MNKTFIIARREFYSRVKKKTFLLSTILLPIIIFAFYGLMIYFSVSNSDQLKVAIADKANVLDGKVENSKNVNFSFLNNEAEAGLKQKLAAKEYDAYVLIPAGTTLATFDTIRMVSEGKIGLMTRDKIEDKLNERVQELKLMSFNVTKAQLDSIQQHESYLDFQTVSGEKESEAKMGVSYMVGFACGFLIYIILFIYGTMVMRGVMEEKVSRIAEVIVSSVRPFQLMMGKIIGIGAVGLLQFFIWIFLVLILQLFLPLIFGADLSSLQAGGGDGAANALSEISKSAASLNIPLIVGCFAFYFLGGYLLYSSLFAAVGSAVNEDPQDAQSLILPIMMPIVFSIVILTKAINAPYSSISVFGSMFPLTSPVVMMARIAHGVPGGVSVTELLLSMALLILGFLGTTWLAGKIYRTGILMYGKKPTWKEMWKWAFKKG